MVKNECMETIYDTVLTVQGRGDGNLKQNGNSGTREFYSNSISSRKSAAGTQGCSFAGRMKQRQGHNIVDGTDQGP